ncbi:MAG: hypothetical protein H0T11_06850 [Chthoniobacterales bacterium]|nr:hypothetical protein [Chthoniobacterales bacterium]
MNSNFREKTLQNIRRLIWLYLWLLIFEGALRKWVVPSLSNPLLIVRDPVVILIYALSIRARVFPRNGWTAAIALIGLISLAVSFIPLWPYLPPTRILLVGGFGFRSNFLHLPLIFVMASVLRREDVRKIGWWALALMPAMALLMAGQFRSAPDAFLNRTAGGEGEMMTSALGKVRTAGTFSFVTGVIAYFALATGFLIWGALKRDVYRSWLLYAAGCAMAIGIAVSGSRSVVAACAVVAASLLVVLVLRPSALNRFGQTVLVAVVLGFIVMQTPIFKEGANVLTTRFNEVAEATEKSVGAGLVERFFGEFAESFRALTHAPILGYGLGIGTNAGAKFLTGRQMFLLSESEWARLYLESGPILGLAFIIWRIALVVWAGLLCLKALKLSNVLPLLLFSGTFLLMISGQFGQPTVLGFAVVGFGLALAALKEGDGDVTASPEPAHLRAPVPRPLPRRSEYARRLHENGASPTHDNGSADR